MACWRTLAAGSGLALVTTSVLVLFVAIAIVVIRAWVGSPRSQAHRAARRAARARRLRRERRETRLEEADVTRDGLAQLTDIVDDVTRWAPAEAARWDLDDLLDRYAEIAVDHQRCRAAMARLDRDALTWVPAMLSTGTPSQRRAVIERRLAWRYRCATRLDALEDQLAEVSALIRLHAQHALFPTAEALLDPSQIDRRLEMFDDQTQTEIELDVELEEAPA